MAVIVLVPVLLTALLGAVAEAHAGGWQPPLERFAVAGPYRFDAAEPHAAGARRGVLLAAPPGSAVRAVCGGVVTFAGRHPALGPGVAIRCGRLVATELGLSSLAVRAGQRLSAGAPIGRLGRSGRLQLGARRAGARHGYRDPLGLLERRGAAPGPVALARPGGGRAARRRAVARAPSPPPSRAPSRSLAPPHDRGESPSTASLPSPDASPASASLPSPDTDVVAPSTSSPPLAWLGAALLGLGAVGGAAARTPRRCRPHAAEGPVPAGG